jgi:predicted RNase H-like HicB family nuclease
MAVVFEANIKVDEDEKWFIELRDMVDGRVTLCHTIEELEEKIELFGEDYGGHIDEVKWSKDDNVLPFVMDDIRVKMGTKRK